MVFQQTEESRPMRDNAPLIVGGELLRFSTVQQRRERGPQREHKIWGVIFHVGPNELPFLFRDLNRIVVIDCAIYVRFCDAS